MHLLGWSRGGQLGYAYLNGESQIPQALRHVAGFIPVDVYLKTDDAQQRQDACARFLSTSANVKSGIFANDTGKNFAPLGLLAQVDPQGETSVPAFKPLTNEQTGHLVGAATFLLVDPPPVPAYHFTGGLWDSSGKVSGLAYTDPARWFDFVSKGKPYQPFQQIADAEASTCDDPSIADVPFDDHLHDITVPVLYVGAGGGYGSSGVYTTTLLGSSDVSTNVVELYPEEQRLLDLGHGDIFYADDADALFWSSIKGFILSH